MSITTNLKSLLQIKVKPRHDSYTDQFNRIFMVKFLMASSMLLCLNWYKDSITCIVPGSSGISSDFVQQACWIQGVYIYKDLHFEKNGFKWYQGYYGFSRELSHDGKRPDGSTCKVTEGDPDCKRLTKTFYLHYQWFPFYIATLALLFYTPYIFFRLINNDIITLKETLKSIEINPEDIVKNYFNYQINPPFRMNSRVLGNIVVKLAYVAANLIAFFGTNNLLFGEFTSFGSDWMKWSRLSHEDAFDYTLNRKVIKPGEVLLPTFALCEVFEYAANIKRTHADQHKFICEISQNVLYHYVLFLLWLALILGVIVSCIGFIMLIVDHFITAMCLWVAIGIGNQTKRIYHVLTLRECEYLEFMRSKNMLVYGHVIRALKAERIDRFTAPSSPDSVVTDDTCEKLMRDTMF